MALTLVNSNPAPTLSWKRKSSANNSVLGKSKKIFPISPTSSKRCNISLQIKGLINNDNYTALSEDEIIDSAFSSPRDNHKPHNSYPPGFVFGASSAAYQVEGATKDHGRGPSIWDTYCEKHPGKIADKSNGEPGAGSYYHYKEDVKALSDIGLNAYRFSISWPRVLPKGRGETNTDGIRYYHNLIDELVRNGIEPHITLFHWDVPQALEDEYGGFLSRRILEDYKNYVELCFHEFGPKVKHWATMNEPSIFCQFGYALGRSAPGHCTPDLKVGEREYTCPDGDSIREPYKVAHNLLLAHAEAVNLFKSKFQDKFGGQIGIVLTTEWFEPYDNSPLNKEAQQRALEFKLGWFLDPLKFGNYPFSMRALVGDRLPIFTDAESEKLKGSFDFIGLNYYTARYAKDVPYNYTYKPQVCTDDGRYAELVRNSANVAIGPGEPGSFVRVYPKGLTKLLLYIKQRYNNPAIYITENGVSHTKDQTESLSEVINDKYRSEYHLYHLHALEDALSQRVNVKGYFVWSLLDSFEWGSGYTVRFGMTYVDYNDNQKRILKDSANYIKRYISNSIVPPIESIPVPIAPIVTLTTSNP